MHKRNNFASLKVDGRRDLFRKINITRQAVGLLKRNCCLCGCIIIFPQWYHHLGKGSGNYWVGHSVGVETGICPVQELQRSEVKNKVPKKVLVALPAGMLEQIDYIAQVEHRNRSDLIRESLRRYIESFSKKQYSVADPSSILSMEAM